MLEPVRAAFAVALVAATCAFAFAILAGPWLLVVLATCALPFLEWTTVPAALVRALPRGVGLILLVAGVLAWLSRSMGALVIDASLIPRLAGPSLLAAAVVFSLAPRRFPAGRTLLPATIGLLAVSGLDPQPEGYGPTALAFLKGSEQTAFAERYLVLAGVVMAALWTGAFLARGPRWSARAAGGLALTLVLSVALAATGVIGLPLFQPHVERAFASAFADGTTGLGGETSLGDFEALALSHRRVLDLETSAPIGAWLLPSEVFTAFDGRRWANPGRSGSGSGGAGRTTVVQPAASVPPASPLLDGLGPWFVTGASPGEPAATVDLRVTQARVDDWPLLLPRGTQNVAASAHALTIDDFGLVRRPPGQALRLYGGRWSDGQSPLAGPLLPYERAEALALPPVVDPRLHSLAERLAAAGGPDERVQATIQHLQTGYRYTLAPGAFRTSDPVAEFLFEKKAAYCEYFATAAVLLLRLQGVPARFVKGLSVGPHSDQGGGLHVVRESAAHAWVEAWVEGRGWVELDPTPPGDFAAAHPPPSAAGRLVEQLRAAVTTAWRRLVDLGPAASFRGLVDDLGRLLQAAARKPASWLALAAALLAALSRPLWRAILRFHRRLRPRHDPAAEAVPADLRALVRELERRWTRVGRDRPPARGLLEHARRLTAASGPTALPTGLAEVGTRIVEAYYRARFGAEMPSGPQLEALRTALDAHSGPAPDPAA
jgi:transglutaminase-like putative cysteine protease